MSQSLDVFSLKMKWLHVISLALLELLLWPTGSALFLDENCGRIHPHPYPDPHLNRPFDPTNNPWMAAVSNEKAFLCGGTLITKNFVLTAAHCIKGQEVLFVELGVLGLRKDGHGSYYRVTSGIVHREYKEMAGPNDIGLLKLQREVNYTLRIRPICILMDEAKSELRKINKFTAYGWGVTRTRNLSQTLQDIQLWRRPSEKCHYDTITDGQFCAGHPWGGGPCNGDGGGPLVAIVQNRTVQVGIISYGRSDCNGSSIHTDVASYTDWIVANVQ